MVAESVAVFRCRIASVCLSFEPERMPSVFIAQSRDSVLHILCMASLDNVRARAAYFSFKVDRYRFSTA